MEFILEGAGYFIWPLGLCSLLAVFIIFERLVALRSSAVIPAAVVEKFISGEIVEEGGDERSVAGRIVKFYLENARDPEAVKAFAGLEIARLERGMFILDIVIAAAPLLGLLGTVTGLIDVIVDIGDTGTPSPEIFSEGIGLALTTTMVGLAIAIPAIAGNSYLNRRIDLFAARLNVGVERLIEIGKAGRPGRDAGARHAQEPSSKTGA